MSQKKKEKRKEKEHKMFLPEFAITVVRKVVGLLMVID